MTLHGLGEFSDMTKSINNKTEKKKPGELIKLKIWSKRPLGSSEKCSPLCVRASDKLYVYLGMAV